MKDKWKQQNELYWMLVLSVLCFGGFYDWTAALTGAAVCVVGIFRIRRTRRWNKQYERWVFLLLLQEMCLVLSSLTAVDRGMNFVGILRFLPVVIWALLCMQYSEEERDRALTAVPDLGCLMVGVGILAFLIPGLRDWFWAAERLGGFFQYSNTCAVFLLLGLMLTAGQEGRSSRIRWSILFWGILLTGSRTVMLLLLLVLAGQVLSIRETREKERTGWRTFLGSWQKLIIGHILAAVFLAAVMVFLTGSYQNLARLATLFTSNSTFYGRLLYWKDAFGLILKHPLGLGWKGYYYIQPAVQTGVYTTLYVHNDLLQSFLDGGWISGLALCALMLIQLKKSRYRALLGVLFIHCLADLDLQYTAIWFAAILMFDFSGTSVWVKKEKRTEYQVYFGAAALIFLYFCLPFGAEYLGKPDVAVFLYPGYTQAKEELLAGTGEAEEAEALADEILKANAYVSLAYDARALAAYSRGDIRSFAENKERVLDIERYDITQYQDYRYLLEQYALYAEGKGDLETVQYCQKCQDGIEERLKKTENETSALAWKLRDQPTFTLE